MADPKGFIKYQRQTPEYRPVAERVQDWKEFVVPLEREELQTQGARCMDCGVPFCQSGNGCPVENLIPEWNDLISQGQWADALVSLHSTNNFPEFTGKLCPAPCESACVLGINADPVAIRSIESSIIDFGFEKGWVQPVIAPLKTGKRVAVVGSGPAGLSAAQQLARHGHTVTVYEKSNAVGGLLRFGIPDFKMEKWVLDRRLDQMREEGVEFKTSVNIGVSVSLAELKQNHDAICLTLGAETPRDLSVPGRDLHGVHFAMEYLDQQNGGRITAQGKRVIIIGGGDTGSDCLGTAHRQGCIEVHQFELLPQPPADRAASTPWPLWPMKLRTSHAHQEGCDRRWSVSSTGFLGEAGRVTGLRAVNLETQIPFEIKADLVLLAMGFTGPVTSGLVESLGLKLDSRGNIFTDAQFRTSAPGVFSAGDARRGASLIVWAIAEGRKMAASVDRFLKK